MSTKIFFYFWLGPLGNKTSYFYEDDRNNLISIFDTGTGQAASYEYDALGRRIKKTVGSNTTLHYYSGNQVIEEQDTSGTTQKQYIYGNGIDDVIRVDVNESGTMVPYYYHTNGIGSITAITDNSGNIKERYAYDVYGSSRHYCPVMGRFLQTDPLGYKDSMNLYQGMNMNPMNFVDPFGLYDIDFHYYTIYYLMTPRLPVQGHGHHLQLNN